MSIEFTGERVVPGHVDVDLWNEHYARYAFAARYCKTARVLDAGCGTGYGSHAISANALSVTGIDQTHDALAYAGKEYAGSSIRWVAASCTQIPFNDRSFDTVLAFEVIEHLQEWPKLISEARRVLKDSGVFVVSTPNKAVYAESREQSGPNPYHEHEFEFEEFTAALGTVFPHVAIVLQNHAECISFESMDAKAAEVRIEGASKPTDASFYIAVCSGAPVEVPSFVYVPEAANLLRERQLHIRRLEGELRTKNEWLDKARIEHAALVELHDVQTRELRASNEWAQELNRKVTEHGARILQLQDELETQHREGARVASEYQARVDELDRELQTRTAWAHDFERRMAELTRLLDTAEATVVERTNWALSIQSELERAQAQVAMARSSRWMKLGRAFNVGPELGG
jgi:SAM-dependent methyltransferase